MNDKLIMENALLLLKGTAEVYVHGTEEASNKKVHDALKNGLETILKMQDDVYQEMTNCGWYQVQNVKISEIEKTLTNLNEN